MNRKSFIRLLLHLLFCVITILFFRWNSFLRPLSCSATYKEYIAAIIVLSVGYLNYFILYPRYYAERRFVRYFLATIVSLVIACLAEEMLVYRQIFEIVQHLEINLHRYFIEQTFLLFIRDSCFVLFFFMNSIIRTLKEENTEIYHYLNKQKHLIIAKDIRKKRTATLSMEDITYCQQIENYSYLWVLSGEEYYKNCSLSDLADYIGSDISVRISRNIIVMYAYVQSYDQNTVFIQTHEGIKGFNITKYYQKEALSQLKSHVKRIYSFDVSAVSVISPPESPVENQEVEQKSQTNETEQKKNVRFVLSFIKDNPDCKCLDITRHFHLSQSTVNRILRQLRNDGLITYEGSKKTGGYRVSVKDTDPHNLF